MRSREGYVVPVACAAFGYAIGAAHGLAVVVKATFSLGAAPLEPVAPEPLRVDELRDASGTVVAASDLVPGRKNVDTIVIGRAALTAVRFTLDQTTAPRLELMRRATPGELAGLGPVPMRHSHQLARDPSGLSTLALPDPCDFDRFQTSPPSQQVAALAGDACMWLDGFAPRGERIEVRLPRCWAAGILYRGAGAIGQLSFRADTLVVDLERGSCSVVWRAGWSLARFADAAELTVMAGVSTERHPLELPGEGGHAQPAPSPAAVHSGAPPVVRAAKNDATLFIPGMDAIAPSSNPAPPSAQPSSGRAPKSAFSGTLPLMAPKSEALPFSGKSAAPAPIAAASLPAAAKGATVAVGPEILLQAAAKAASIASSAPASAKSATLAVTAPKSEALPFSGKSAAPAPSGAASLPAAAKGATLAVSGGAGVSLPFGDARNAIEEARRKADEIQRRADDARQAEARKAAAEQLEREKAEAEAARVAAEQAKQQRKEAEERREAERKRFEEEQKRLREVDAERSRSAAKRARDEAARLDDALYGDFKGKR